jgi:hypothetical protein
MKESNQREVAPKFLSPTVSVIFLVNFPGKISKITNPTSTTQKVIKQ